jgi:peptide/nickel transport system ATP-binding protein
MIKQSQSPTEILKLEDLCIEYRVRSEVREAVRGVSFGIKAGEAVGIVGESGSGKSTVARSLIGLLPRPAATISSGAIFIQGTDVTHFTDRQWEKFRGNPIAMIFQDPLSYLNPIKKVGRQIREAAVKHSPDEDGKVRTLGLLETVNLPAATYDAFPYQLSGGMRQRVLIAIALACNPVLLIADEPTTALDPTTQAEILKLLKELRVRLGMSLLIISHDLEMVASECDFINVMYSGKIVESGTSKKVFTTPEHPYTRALLRCARAELNADGRFVTIDRLAPELVQAIANAQIPSEAVTANIARQTLHQ